MGSLRFGCLVIWSSFLSLQTLSTWGLPLLLIGGAFITYGLLPYRRLMRLENNPYQIIISESEQLIFFMDKHPLLKIPLKDIEEIAFLDDDHRYGIGLWLKKPLSNDLEYLSPNQTFEQYRTHCQKEYFCDVFFPYFSNVLLKN